MSDQLESGLGSLSISSNDAPRPPVADAAQSTSEESGNGHSSSGGNLPMRRRDQEHNFLVNAPRPGLCKAAARRIDVVANYFRVTLPSLIKVYKYQLDFEVEQRGAAELVTKREKCNELFWLFYEQNVRLFPPLNQIVFDGSKTLYCASQMQLPELRQGQTNLKFTGPIERRDSNYQLIPSRGGRVARYRVTIIPIPMVVVERTQGKQMSTEDATFLVQFIDLALTQPHRCPLTAVHRRFYTYNNTLFKIPQCNNDEDVKKIGRGLQVWTGLHTALKLDTPVPLLNCNTSFSVFYEKEMGLVQFVAEVLYDTTMEQVAASDLSSLCLSPGAANEVFRALKGTRIRIRLPDGRDKYKKFDQISKQPANQYMFVLEQSGQRISVAEYYRGQYGIVLQAPSLQCLLFTKKAVRGQPPPKPAAFPMEFCHVFVDVKRLAGRLNDRQLAAMITAASRDPANKRRDIERLISSQGEHLGRNPIMEHFNIEMEQEMITIKDVVVLPKPQLMMGSGLIEVEPNTGEHGLTYSEGAEKILKAPGRFAIPYFLYIRDMCKKFQNDRPYFSSRAMFFMRTLEEYGVKLLKDRGDQCGIEGYRQRQSGGYEADERTIKDMVGKALEACDRAYKDEGLEEVPIPLFVFVFDRRMECLYSTIKSVCDVHKGVVSQCVLQKQWANLEGKPIYNTTSTNLMLKVVAKLGGVHYRIDGGSFKNWAKVTNPEDPTLFLGIDVSHPGVEERAEALQKVARPANRPQHNLAPSARPQAASLFENMSFYDCPRSVLAVVANVDTECMNFQASSRVQRIYEEEGRNLIDLFSERVQEFHRNTKLLPKHVVVLRDGVSDTMFNKVRHEETKALEAALVQFYGIDALPTITYIVAKKRHNCRLFPTERRPPLNPSDPGNLLPGVLVETDVVSERNFDFFLLSHFGTKGTARPTHYTVLRDDWKPSTAFWQTIMYALAYGNLRCPKPLSIPSPLHYAHLAAKRAKLLFDKFRGDPTDEYARSKEDLFREGIESKAIRTHDTLREMNSMPFM